MFQILNGHIAFSLEKPNSCFKEYAKWIYQWILYKEYKIFTEVLAQIVKIVNYIKANALNSRS